MTSEIRSTPDPEAIEAAASVWLSLRDRGMSEREAAEFMRWLQESPKHAEVFTELDVVWRDFDRVGALRPVAASQPAPDLLVPRPRVQRRALSLWSRALAAAAAVALGWIGWQQLTAGRPTAETAVGSFQKLDLPDGSVVQLNTDSAIQVRYSDTERRIELLRGEAHFDVARNPARPFVVAAGFVAVRAVGTAFNLHRRAEALDVLVTEGKVQVNDWRAGVSLLPAHPERGGPAVLVQGERAIVPLTVDPAAAPPVVAVAPVAAPEMRRALAWQERRLEFDGLPLAEVVAEFNRYNQTKLIIADPAIAAKRFSGAFRADGYEPFVRLLEENFRVTATRTAQGIELHAKP